MRKALWLFSLLLVVAPFAGHATSMVPLTLSQLEEASERIVVASPVAQRCIWRGKTIVTIYTLAVAESVKGAAAATLEVELPGGSMREPYPVTMTVPGVPHLPLKQRALLFLQTRKTAGYTITGWVQGCYPIERDKDGRETVHVPSFVLGTNAKSGVDASGKTRLSDFVREIHKATAEREARPK